MNTGETVAKAGVVRGEISRHENFCPWPQCFFNKTSTIRKEPLKEAITCFNIK